KKDASILRDYGGYEPPPKLVAESAPAATLVGKDIVTSPESYQKYAKGSSTLPQFWQEAQGRPVEFKVDGAKKDKDDYFAYDVSVKGGTKATLYVLKRETNGSLAEHVKALKKAKDKGKNVIALGYDFYVVAD